MTARLVPTDTAQLVADYRAGLPLRALAAKHGLSQTTIWRRLLKSTQMMRRPGTRAQCRGTA